MGYVFFVSTRSIIFTKREGTPRNSPNQIIEKTKELRVCGGSSSKPLLKLVHFFAGEFPERILKPFCWDTRLISTLKVTNLRFKLDVRLTSVSQTFHHCFLGVVFLLKNSQETQDEVMFSHVLTNDHLEFKGKQDFFMFVPSRTTWDLDKQKSLPRTWVNLTSSRNSNHSGILGADPSCFSHHQDDSDDHFWGLGDPKP